ncbi:MAG: hydroxymethylglutaryl-CoA reductase [Terracidiphilus sp.]
MASNEDRIGRFLRRLLQRRSALEIVQSLARDERPIPRRIPGGSSVSDEDVESRWQLLEVAETSKRALYDRAQPEALEPYRQNIENCIGTVKVPVGLAGPLRIRGMFASGDFYIPLATTEAALVASYARGARAITEAGGCVSILLHEGMRRTPGFALRSLTESGLFAIWCMEKSDALRAAAAATTRHGELIDIGMAVEGNHVYLILDYTTGDASGQNMVTIATEAVCEYIMQNATVRPEYFFVEANLSGDKKATAHSFVTVRGKKVSAEVTLPSDLVASRLRTTPKELERYWKMSAIGAIQSGSIGVQGHFANALAALYIACGQDPACVAESAVGVTRFDVTESGDLYASVTLPSIVVGTVGGATALPSQHACLEIMGLAGDRKAQALAEVCAGLALAGELSITAALCSGDFTRAHQKLARGNGAAGRGDHR